MTCVLVDVDGTVLPAPSCERLFFRYLVWCGALGPRQLVEAAVFPLRWGPRYGRHVLKKNKAYLTGLGIDAVERRAAAFVRDRLTPRLRSFMMVRIGVHLDRGDTVALLTGAPDFIAGPLAAAVGAEAWCATRYAIRDGRFTADPPIAHPFGAEKLALGRELCAGLGCALEDAVAYADSGHDLPLLRAVARPVAVLPDAPLARAAHERGWAILAGD